MPDKPHKQERQTTLWKSDDRIGPVKCAGQARGSKPGNAGAGKAVRPSRDSDIRRPHPVAEVRCWSDWIASPNERNRIRKRRSIISSRCSPTSCCGMRSGSSSAVKAKGVDEVTVDQYEEHLQANLQDLLARLHRGAYRPHPSLRCDIPKGNGKTRPLGIATITSNCT